jgi:8-oxo-dGTP pyrophosphatase MutT (NUDIX family)
MKIIDKVALIVTNNGSILSTKSKGKNKYYIPGGKRENEETDVQTLTREIYEELNVVIIENTIKYVGTFSAQADSEKEGVIVTMICYSAEFTGVCEPSNEIEEIRWLNYSDIEIVSEVDKIIFKHLKQEKLLE